MDIKQLINFITIVEEGNITKAAQKLHLSQPPLSNQLKSLEQELGVKLVERGSRKITLTDVGNLLYKRGKDMISMFESTLNEVEDFKSGIEGVLKIGAVSTCNQFVPDKLVSPYTRQYPKVRFELYEGNTYEVVDMIEKGIVDIGVVRTPFNRENLCCMSLRTEPMVAVINNSQKFDFGDREKISLKDLNNKPIIIYRRYEKLIMQVLNMNDIKASIYCLNDDGRTTVAWAQAGLAIGIVPKSVINTSNREIKVYEIEEDDLKTDIAVIWLENKYLSKSARHLLDMIKETDF